ncbi:MAG TPA: O-antigen biosynthesis protein, partial [Xanthomonadaceae bacterium]|nr:O-antigen biosynthesis protein [Xanthomonadaceae bacterium]
MPAYKARYIERALDSVLAQTYPSLELVVCDDSSGALIEDIVAQKQADAPFPVRYCRNQTRLGELGSTARGIRLAAGKYVKFLHDDDELQPDCVAALVAAMEADPGAALASSRRIRIDEDSQPLPDILATCVPFAEDSLVDGRELVSFLGDHTVNFIGEPSCVLCRREHLLEIADQLMSLNGKPIHWVGDLAMYAKLLQRGNLVFLTRPLTRFRVSQDQFSQAGRDKPGIGEQGHADFRQAIRDLGWYRDGGDNRLVRVAAITPLKARVFRPQNLLAALVQAAGMGGIPPVVWLGARRPDPTQRALMTERLQAHDGGPRIAILLIDRDRDPAKVDRTVAGLDALDLPVHHQVRTLRAPADDDAQARHALVDSINRALGETAADWVLLIDAGTEFTTGGLLVAAVEILGLPASCAALYADEVIRLEEGKMGLALRPDLNLDMLLGFPSGLSRHWLFRRDVLLAKGGFSRDAGQAFELDYQLRLIEQDGLGCIAHLGEPLLAADARPAADEDARAVLARHLHSRGYGNARIESRLPGCYEIDYGHPHSTSVSVAILVEGRLAQVQRCLETLLGNTSFANYEVLLLDHGNEDAELCRWLDGIEQMQSRQIRVLRFPGALPRQAVRNQAALQARGEFLLWLASGAGIIGKDWLQQMLNHAQRPEVGAVGAKLLSADGRVRHAGLLLGLHGPAGRAFEGSAFDDAGYLQRLQVDQDYSALSEECLMLRRELFLEAGGFDEDPLIARWADVDLCLKLRQAGYLNVWTPRAQLLVDAPAAAAATAAEEDAMYARWLPLRARGPAYNAGFSLQAEAG